jgi:putative transcriptional regulator
VTRSAGPVRPEFDGYGERIKARRLEVGLTQSAMAEALSVSRQTVISMEADGYAPSVFLALKVAETLATTVEALWKRTPLDLEHL